MRRMLALVAFVVLAVPAAAQAASPSPVASSQVSSWTTTGSSKSVSLSNLQAGDLLVAYGGSEDQAVAVSVRSSGVTWTQRQRVNQVGFGRAYLWTADVPASGDRTVTFARSGGVSPYQEYGGGVVAYRGATGIGASGQATGNGAPSVNVTTQQADSALVGVSVDWLALDGASRAWLPGVGETGELTYARGAGHYTVYAARHADTGAVGGKAFGLNAPGGQKYSIAAVEVKGTAAPPPDTTPPDTSIDSGPADGSTTTSTSASFTFSGTDDVAVGSIQCRLDGGSWVSCTSPFGYGGLAVGQHTFEARALDTSGNADPTPASRTWTIVAPDTSAPDTTITDGPANGSTTSSTDASFSFDGTDNVGVTGFDCKLDDGAFEGCSSPKAYSSLAVGQHTFSVRARDAAGNVDQSPASRTWTVGEASFVNVFGDAVPQNPSQPDTEAVELGLKWRADAAGDVLGVRFYKGSANTGTHTGTLWSASGQQLARGTFSGETATGWQELRFANPVAIQANTDYTVSYHAPNGGYAADRNFAWPKDSGVLHGLAGTFCYSAQVCFPASTYQSSNYYVDVVYRQTGVVEPPPPSPPDAGWRLCAKQYQWCSYRGPYELRMGTHDGEIWSATRQVTDADLECTGSNFGGDPAPSSPTEVCEYRPYGPDQDSDGVRDNRDQCQAEAGPDSNSGCPTSGLGPGRFPVGVWQQGTSNAAAYQSIGVNTYIGFPQWPSGDENADVLAMQRAQDAGMKVYPDWSQTALTWINSHPQFASTLEGWLIGDENDMAHNFRTAAAVNQTIATVKQADPGRPVYANYGLSYCAWPFNNTGISEQNKYDYVANLDRVSCDFYALSDGVDWLGTESNAIWAYGYGIDLMERYAANKPVWGFLEAQLNDNHYVTADEIKKVVWNQVVHGADGTLYFCHEWQGGQLVSETACLKYADKKAAIGEVDADVRQYADVLRAPEKGGSAVGTGDVPVAVRVHAYNGQTWVFAMGDGTPAAPNGRAQDATITVPGAGSGTVTVDGEGRTVQMQDGQFTDHFGAYEHHVYRIGG